MTSYKHSKFLDVKKDHKYNEKRKNKLGKIFPTIASLALPDPASGQIIPALPRSEGGGGRKEPGTRQGSVQASYSHEGRNESMMKPAS